jgi:hypothetical protein
VLFRQVDVGEWSTYVLRCFQSATVIDRRYSLGSVTDRCDGRAGGGSFGCRGLQSDLGFNVVAFAGLVDLVGSGGPYFRVVVIEGEA